MLQVNCLVSGRAGNRCKDRHFFYYGRFFFAGGGSLHYESPQGCGVWGGEAPQVHACGQVAEVQLDSRRSGRQGVPLSGASCCVGRQVVPGWVPLFSHRWEMMGKSRSIHLPDTYRIPTRGLPGTYGAGAVRGEFFVGCGLGLVGCFYGVFVGVGSWVLIFFRDFSCGIWRKFRIFAFSNIEFFNIIN